MAKVKIWETTSLQLDWLVASLEGYTDLRISPHRFAGEDEWIMNPPRTDYGPVLLGDFEPSTDWAQGGPIIEREKISLGNTFTGPEGSFAIQTGWYAYRHIYGGVINPPRYTGSTPLIAAMRCYVASKLGDEVEVPELNHAL